MKINTQNWQAKTFKKNFGPCAGGRNSPFWVGNSTFWKKAQKWLIRFFWEWFYNQLRVLNSTRWLISKNARFSVARDQRLILVHFVLDFVFVFVINKHENQSWTLLLSSCTVTSNFVPSFLHETLLQKSMHINWFLMHLFLIVLKLILQPNTLNSINSEGSGNSYVITGIKTSPFASQP